MKSQLQVIRKDDLSINQYLAQIKETADKLSSIAEPISLQDHISHILEGLGVEYNATVTSILNQRRSYQLTFGLRISSQQQNSVDHLNTIQENLANLQSIQPSNAKRYHPNSGILSPPQQNLSSSQGRWASRPQTSNHDKI